MGKYLNSTKSNIEKFRTKTSLHCLSNLELNSKYFFPTFVNKQTRILFWKVLNFDFSRLLIQVKRADSANFLHPSLHQPHISNHLLIKSQKALKYSDLWSSADVPANEKPSNADFLTGTFQAFLLDPVWSRIYESRCLSVSEYEKLHMKRSGRQYWQTM